MTTEADSNDPRYFTHRNFSGRLPRAIHNPHDKPIEELPTIYGFNNGGSDGWYSGVLLAEDGTHLGGHICSNESFMLGDLGILEGRRLDRHETFQKHYPDGYRMEFVSSKELDRHEGFKRALERNAEKGKKASA